MTRPGPRPVPSAIKLLRGTLRADRVAGSEPVPAPGPLVMPRGILTTRGRAVWRQLVPELERLRLVAPLDVPALVLLVGWVSVAYEALEELRRDGIIDQDSRGRERTSRAISALRAASVEFRQLSSLFGLSPADRSRLAVPPPEELDELEMLIVRREMFRMLSVDGSEEEE